jgi:hypothetical protein
MVAGFDLIVRYYSRASLALIGPSYTLCIVTLKALMALGMSVSLKVSSMGMDAIMHYRIVVQCFLAVSVISTIVLHYRCINDVDINEDVITIIHPLASN